MKFSRVAFAVLFMQFTNLSAMAEEIRTQHPASIGISAGDPAPSLPGFVVGYQLSNEIQVVFGTGFFSRDGINIQPLAANARIFIFQSEFSPFLGAGISYLKFEGSEQYQGLDDSTLLGSLLIGLDWVAREDFRVTLGYTFHYPLQLTFPFVELSYML